jgi:flagella basal body P-ring formation protein FlgA
MMRLVLSALVVLCVVATSSWAGADRFEALDLQEVIRSQVEEELPASLSLVQVDVPGRASRSPVKSVSIEWRRAPRVGRMSVQIVLTHRDGKVQRTWASLEIACLKQVLVATRTLVPGTVVRNGDIALRSRAVAKGQGIEASVSSLVGRRVIGTVNSDAIILPGMINLPPPLDRGSQVKVVVLNGLLKISTVGTLAQKSRIGEIATVRLGGAAMPVRGRLITASTLILEGAIR